MRKKLQAWGSLPAVLFSLFLFIYCPSFSQGGPDPAFGNAGIVTTNIGFGATSEVVNAIALQPDGKIVAVGYVMPFANSSQRFFNVARYNPDGTLDAGFGTGGLVRTDFGTEQFPTDGHATDVEILDDGSILVVGHVTGNPDNTRKIALALYQPNGALQTSFGSGGKLFVGENLVGYSTDAFLTMQG
ncbi:MAG TPA: delta-60 repeat domain-containing protein, partial [Chitinophagaceae bacterium]